MPGQCLILSFYIDLTYTPNDVLNSTYYLYIDDELIATGTHPASGTVDYTAVLGNTVLNSGVSIRYRVVIPNSVNNHTGQLSIRLTGYWLGESKPTT